MTTDLDPNEWLCLSIAFSFVDLENSLIGI